MEFKIYDIVFLDKRGLFLDNTIVLSKNRPYTVNEVRGNYVRLLHNTIWYHEKHFQLWDVSSGFIQGVNYFKNGDKVKLECFGMIDFEMYDFAKLNNMSLNEIYEVDYYLIEENMQKYVKLINRRCSMHPNHFKKVEDV